MKKTNYQQPTFSVIEVEDVIMASGSLLDFGENFMDWGKFDTEGKING